MDHRVLEDPESDVSPGGEEQSDPEEGQEGDDDDGQVLVDTVEPVRETLHDEGRPLPLTRHCDRESVPSRVGGYRVGIRKRVLGRRS